jgi:hypothetical protein
MSWFSSAELYATRVKFPHLDIHEYGHLYVSIFAISIFEHEISEVLKALGVSSDKLVAGEDTDVYHLASALKDNEKKDDFHAKILPFLANEQEEFIVDRFNEAEAFRHLMVHNSMGMLPSVQECRRGVRVLQRLLTAFKRDAAASRLGTLYEQLSLDVIISEVDPLVLAKFLASNLLGKFERTLSSWLLSVEKCLAKPLSLYGFIESPLFIKECERKPDFDRFYKAVKGGRAASIRGLCHWLPFFYSYQLRKERLQKVELFV